MVLERRTTGTTSDDHSSGKKKRQGRRPTGSRASTKTASSRDTKSTGKRKSSFSSGKVADVAEAVEVQAPSLTDLKLEEERLRLKEETEVERKREAAQRLALERGLSGHEDDIKFPPEEAAKDTRYPIEVPPSPTEEEDKATPPLSEEDRNPISEDRPISKEATRPGSPIPASSPEPKPPDSAS
ncbi:MAG: hypothetical protein LQ347_004527 [Umbilicaria vellea]|nr:MAG: hypothetical protein LQ347_004527 [Umbilicaria vellea]